MSGTLEPMGSAEGLRVSPVRCNPGVDATVVCPHCNARGKVYRGTLPNPFARTECRRGHVFAIEWLPDDAPTGWDKLTEVQKQDVRRIFGATK